MCSGKPAYLIQSFIRPSRLDRNVLSMKDSAMSVVSDQTVAGPFTTAAEFEPQKQEHQQNQFRA